MRFTTFLLCLLLAGCATKPTTAPVTFKPVPPPLPPTPGMAKLLPRTKALVAPESLSSVVVTPAAGIGSILLARNSSNNCTVVSWSIRPVNYAIECSTDMQTWQTLGQNTEPNFVLAPNQVFVTTTLFPSGKAVKFTDGTPVIEFLDYDIGGSMKFYRIRETQP